MYCLKFSSASPLRRGQVGPRQHQHRPQERQGSAPAASGSESPKTSIPSYSRQPRPHTWKTPKNSIMQSTSTSKGRTKTRRSHSACAIGAWYMCAHNHCVSAPCQHRASGVPPIMASCNGIAMASCNVPYLVPNFMQYLMCWARVLSSILRDMSCNISAFDHVHLLG